MKYLILLMLLANLSNAFAGAYFGPDVDLSAGTCTYRSSGGIEISASSQTPRTPNIVLNGRTSWVGIGTSVPTAGLSLEVLGGSIKTDFGLDGSTLAISGNSILGDALGDSVALNAGTVSIGNSLNIDNNTVYLDSILNYVGINTNVPSEPLHVQGDVHISGGLGMGAAPAPVAGIDFGTGGHDDLQASDVTDLTDSGVTTLHHHGWKDSGANVELETSSDLIYLEQRCAANPDPDYKIKIVDPFVSYIDDDRIKWMQFVAEGGDSISLYSTEPSGTSDAAHRLNMSGKCDNCDGVSITLRNRSGANGNRNSLWFEETSGWKIGRISFLKMETDHGKFEVWVATHQPTGPSLAFVIDNLHRVGIRTDTPSQPLHVKGQIYSEIGGFRFPDNTVQTTSADPDVTGWHDDNGVTRLVDSTDWVGIGTTDPVQKLEVIGSIRADDGIYASTGSVSSWLLVGYYNVGDQFDQVATDTTTLRTDLTYLDTTTIKLQNHLQAGSTFYVSSGSIDGQALFARTSGAVGVGTETPTEKLDVYNGNIKTNYGVNSATLTTSGNVILGDGQEDLLTVNAGSVTIGDQLNFDANTLFLDGLNNRVGINTTTPAYELDVIGDISADEVYVSSIVFSDGSRLDSSSHTHHEDLRLKQFTPWLDGTNNNVDVAEYFDYTNGYAGYVIDGKQAACDADFGILIDVPHNFVQWASSAAVIWVNTTLAAGNVGVTMEIKDTTMTSDYTTPKLQVTSWTPLIIDTTDLDGTYTPDQKFMVNVKIYCDSGESVWISDGYLHWDEVGF